MSFACYVILRGEKPCANALRFATYDEANAYGIDLLSRWFVPESFEVRETPDPVNYRMSPSGAMTARDDGSGAQS